MWKIPQAHLRESKSRCVYWSSNQTTFQRPVFWSNVKWHVESSMAILWKCFEWFSGKFQSCKFQRTFTRSDGFVWTAGGQYVAENELFFIFTPGFLSIKLWWRKRRTWRELPSRRFGDGAQVQREMERCHVRWLLLNDEKWCSWSKYHRQAKRTRR